jgi:hypothetical protein
MMRHVKDAGLSGPTEASERKIDQARPGGAEPSGEPRGEGLGPAHPPDAAGPATPTFRRRIERIFPPPVQFALGIGFVVYLLLVEGASGVVELGRATLIIAVLSFAGRAAWNWVMAE